MTRRRPTGRFRSAVGGGSVDRTDVLVIGSVTVLIAGVLVLGMVARGNADAAAPVVERMPAPSASATPSAAAVIDLIATGADETKAIAAGLGHPAGAAVHVHTGGGYVAAQRSFASIADTVDPDSSLVIVVPATSDSAVGTIALVKQISRTVAAVRKAAPKAAILLAGPVAPAGASSQLSSMRDAVHGAALATDEHWIDPIAKRWVGVGQVDATGAITADGFTAVGAGVGAEASVLLAG